MGRRLRMYSEEGLYFVTARVIQGRSLLRPGARLNEVVGGVLARGARLFGVELHGYTVSSNHLHLVSTAPDCSLSDFMRYVLGNLSKKVGALVGWRGPFWERRFASEPILGPESAVNRLTYVLSHGVKEGLVRRPAEWPGLNCAEQLLSGESRSFPFHQWCQRWKSGRLSKEGNGRWDPSCATTETLHLTPLPAWKGLTPEDRRSRVESILAAIEQTGREVHARVVGAAKVLRRDPHHRPERLKRTPEPWCHADSPQLLQEYRATYRHFADWFRQASARFLAGDMLVEFPPRAFKPSAWGRTLGLLTQSAIPP